MFPKKKMPIHTFLVFLCVQFQNRIYGSLLFDGIHLLFMESTRKSADQLFLQNLMKARNK